MNQIKFFSGFYKHSISRRIELIEEWLQLDIQNKDIALSEDIANQMIENYVFNYILPEGVVVNLKVNDKEYVVPMAIEEPSVIAAASLGAKTLGNIQALTEERLLIGQVIMTHHQDFKQLESIIRQNKDLILEHSSRASQSMVNRGGGPRDVWIESKNHPKEKFVSVYLSLDPCDAMGANVINTVLESISPLLESLLGGEVLMAILSNYQEQAVTKATVEVPVSVLGQDIEEARKIAYKIQLAAEYASIDPYRATTHNKGIMNGIDGVVMATGNDWRAIEAGVHAYAAKDGHYSSLTTWEFDEDRDILKGSITIPLQIATVGGTLSNHPTAKLNLEMMRIESSRELANVIAAVGLVQNFSAVRALVSDGIQKGHMRMQARSLALQVGATIDEIPDLVQLLTGEPRMNRETATRLLDSIRNDKN